MLCKLACIIRIIAMSENEETAGQNNNAPLHARRVCAFQHKNVKSHGILMAWAGKLRAFSFRYMARLFSPSVYNYCRGNDACHSGSYKQAESDIQPQSNRRVERRHITPRHSHASRKIRSPDEHAGKQGDISDCRSEHDSLSRLPHEQSRNTAPHGS